MKLCARKSVHRTAVQHFGTSFGGNISLRRSAARQAAVRPLYLTCSRTGYTILVRRVYGLGFDPPSSRYVCVVMHAIALDLQLVCWSRLLLSEVIPLSTTSQGLRVSSTYL